MLCNFEMHLRRLGQKNYELTNHLGNVLSVITDNINMSVTDGVYATVVSATDYYPFGLEMKGRTYSDDKYRYGFNGKEKDASFGGTVMDYGFRIYNPRYAKFLSVDPLTKSYPWYTPYQFAGNKPIAAIDLDGAEEVIRINYRSAGGGAGEITKTSIILINSRELKEERANIFHALNGEIPAEGRFNQSNYYWPGTGYSEYTKGEMVRGYKGLVQVAPQTGELTIDVHTESDGKDFYNFSYSKTITEDDAYRSTISDRNFGIAYDLAKGTQDLGNNTAKAGLLATATIYGAEVGLPLMQAGNSIALGGDIAEVVIDVFHGDITEASIVAGSNAPDWLFKKLAGKTGLGEAYPAALEPQQLLLV